MRILLILVLGLVAFWAVQDRKRLSNQISELNSKVAKLRTEQHPSLDDTGLKIKEDYMKVLGMLEMAQGDFPSADLAETVNQDEEKAPGPRISKSTTWLQERIANRQNPLGDVPKLSSPAYRRSPLADMLPPVLSTFSELETRGSY